MFREHVFILGCSKIGISYKVKKPSASELATAFLLRLSHLSHFLKIIR